MFKKIAIIAALATGGIVLAPAQEADAGCKSNWMKLSSAFKKLSPAISKGVCKHLNKDDEAAANKCIEDYEKAVEAISKVVKEYNADAGGGKVGPRGLGTNRWYTGKLLVERTFIGMPVMSDEYTLEFKGDGGKNKKSYTVEICFVDPEDGGNVIEPVKKTFTNNNGRYKQTFKGVYGARPMVYLKNSKPAATKAHRYKLYGDEGGTPQIILDAKKIVASPSKKKLKPNFRKRR